jgi:hypothetical protein
VQLVEIHLKEEERKMLVISIIVERAENRVGNKELKP